MSGEDLDLIVLVADSDAEWAVRTLLEKRYQSLKLRPLHAKVIKHTQRDAGVYLHCHELLRQFQHKARHALVMLDHHGSGREAKEAEEIEKDIEERLAKSGWSDRGAAVVFSPELEIWVWSSSPRVADVIGLPYKDLQRILEQEPRDALGKPEDPKSTLEKALYKSKRPFSSRIFQELADVVSLRHCHDRAFNKFRHTLQNWFSQH